MKKLYSRFERAAGKRDVTTIRKIVRCAPKLHGCVGHAGGLVEILDREAPELLEAALAAGLHPDAG